jgi:peroxiredoxin
MDTSLLLASLLLASVFAVAGVTKLVDGAGTSDTLADFGLPRWIARPLRILLPVVELTIAILLITRAGVWWGGLAALGLLAIFTIGIAVNLGRGRKPECHCFGQLRARPISWRTLIRNAVFAGVAGFIVWQGHDTPGLSLVVLISDLILNHTFSFIAFAFAVFLFTAQGWLIVHLLGQHGRLLVRLDNIELTLAANDLASHPALNQQKLTGLPPGSPAPSFELPLLSGCILTLNDLQERGKPILLIFSDPNCSPCSALLPDIAHWQSALESKLTIVLVSSGGAEANRAKTHEYELNVLLQEDRAVAKQYRAEATPSAVLVNADGSIGSSLAIGSQAIVDLVTRTTGASESIALAAANGNSSPQDSLMAAKAVNALAVGEACPAFSLTDLNGFTVELDDFQGRSVLVLFWSPSCGFCKKMLPELKSWERTRLDNTPELLVISTGTAPAEELRATALLDQTFGVARSFGVEATPSAVLIDAGGRIGSEVAVGKPAVLALLARMPAMVSA